MHANQKLREPSIGLVEKSSQHPREKEQQPVMTFTG